MNKSGKKVCRDAKKSQFCTFKYVSMFSKKVIPIFPLLIVLLLPQWLFGQNSDSLKMNVPELRKWVQFDGVLKNKFEVSTNKGVMRFNVRNSRVGVRGDLGDYVSYRFQVELSAEGSFSVLDLYGTLKPFKGLSFIFGQVLLPFENTYIVNVADMLFANKPFLGDYFTQNSRDMGLMMNYKFLLGSFPIEAQAGLFNGRGINNPQWATQPTYGFRLIVGAMERFRATAKILHYQTELVNHFLWGADIHYAHERFRIEAEVRNRKNIPTGRNLSGAYMQGAWYYNLHHDGMFHYISPALRWDAMGYDIKDRGVDVNRITLGVDFGLALKPFESVLRLNYEHFFVQKDAFLTYFENRDPYVADNKITLELMIKF